MWAILKAYNSVSMQFCVLLFFLIFKFIHDQINQKLRCKFVHETIFGYSRATKFFFTNDYKIFFAQLRCNKNNQAIINRYPLHFLRCFQIGCLLK